MSHKAFIKNNTIYLEAGYLFAGEFNEITAQLKEEISSLKVPFQAIVSFIGTLTSDSLVHPDDVEMAKKLFDMLSEAGRDLAVWIIPRDCILCKELFKMVGEKSKLVQTCETMAEAEEILRQYRS